MLPLAVLPILKSLLPHLPHGEGGRPRALCFGYPDIMADTKEIAGVFDPQLTTAFQYRDDGERVIAWHNMKGKVSRVVESTSFFNAIGLDVDYVDINRSRGVERIVDLNEPLPADMAGRYACVLDIGTTEHCFNIGQAMSNVAGALAAGGFALHASPLNLFNHGFYIFNPTFFADFYQQNGFEIVYLASVTASWPTKPYVELPPYDRFEVDRESAGIVAVARKVASQAIAWPMQTKYKRAPGLVA
jgi:hypothetical protein